MRAGQDTGHCLPEAVVQTSSLLLLLPAQGARPGGAGAGAQDRLRQGFRTWRAAHRQRLRLARARTGAEHTPRQRGGAGVWPWAAERGARRCPASCGGAARAQGRAGQAGERRGAVHQGSRRRPGGLESLPEQPGWARHAGGCGAPAAVRAHEQLHGRDCALVRRYQLHFALSCMFCSVMQGGWGLSAHRGIGRW